MELINKVAQSSLKTIDLEKMYPSQVISEFDLKPYLFHELILKEKDFRAAMSNIEWAQYQDHILCIHCSNDAIIPVWAYMLVCVHATPFVYKNFGGNKQDFLSYHYTSVIQNIDPQDYTDAKLVIKGCSDKPVPYAAYVAITSKLQPFAQSIMYGEPCSTVPLFKKPKA